MFRRFVNRLASPVFIFWLLPPFMVLVAAGTIAQKYVGLYVAEKLVFSSFVIWLFDIIPLPGGYTLMALIGLSLAVKFLFKSSWTLRRAPNNIAHFGALILLLGGLATVLLAEDGFVTLPTGAQGSQLRDYHQRDLMVVKGGNIVATVDAATLKPGVVLSGAEFPFRLQVRETCHNCSITARTPQDETLKGMARGMQLTPAKLQMSDEANTGGLTFDITGLSPELNGTYILFEDGPTTKLGDYELAYGKQIRQLPFTIKLEDVTKVNYPGTDTAKGYYSDVMITDSGLSWPARIAMNEPLHYRGYTLYQSSYLETADGQKVSTLAVSFNQSQFLPYLGTGIMALGLLLQAILRARGRA